MRRISALTAFVLLLSFWTVPADAGTRRPRLTDSSVSVSPPEVTCDPSIFHDCGYFTVSATFSGLARYAYPNSMPVFFAEGTANLARTYGCETPRGKRLRAYDVTVRQVESLSSYRGSPYTITEDVATLILFPYTDDAQPGNCPTGTEPRLYRMVVSKVRVELRPFEHVGFDLPPFPGGVYRIPGRSVWNGAALTPVSGR